MGAFRYNLYCSAQPYHGFKVMPNDLRQSIIVELQSPCSQSADAAHIRGQCSELFWVYGSRHLDVHGDALSMWFPPRIVHGKVILVKSNEEIVWEGKESSDWFSFRSRPSDRKLSERCGEIFLYSPRKCLITIELVLITEENFPACVIDIPGWKFPPMVCPPSALQKIRQNLSWSTAKDFNILSSA